MKYLRPSIFNLLSSITGLTNKVFYMRAPQEIMIGTTKTKVVMPYVVFQSIDGTPDSDTGSNFETKIFQISVYAKTPTEAENISKQIEEKFFNNEAGLHSTHYFCDRLDREFTKDFTDDEDIYKTIIQYKAQLTIR